MTCRIRAARNDDESRCGEIISAATLAAPTAERLPHARALFSDSSPLPTEGYDRLVATRGDRVAGFCDFDRERGHVRYLFVDPEAQGRGIGETLVAAAPQACGGAALTLNCFAVNDSALGWYLRHGFEIYGGGWTEVAGQPVVEIYLRQEAAKDSGSGR